MFKDLAGKAITSNPNETEKLRQDARNWFFGEGDFVEWCLMAEYGPEKVREGAKRIRESGMEGISWRAAPGRGKRYEERRAYRERAGPRNP